MKVLREVRQFCADEHLLAARKKASAAEDMVDFKFDSGRLIVNAVGSRKLVVMMCIDKPQFSWICRSALR